MQKNSAAIGAVDNKFAPWLSPLRVYAGRVFACALSANILFVLPANSSEPAPVGDSAEEHVAVAVPPKADQMSSVFREVVLRKEDPPAKDLSVDSDDLSNADRVTIKSPGIADIAGDYRISSAHVISVPVIGRINVDGMDVATLESKLSEAASKIAGRDAYVSVEVAEYRPLFVTGLITRPGAIPWKPGMTVLEAVAASGGIFRPQMAKGADGSMGMGAEVEAVRLRKAIVDQKNAVANLARLYTERSGGTKIDVPDRLVKLVGVAAARQLIDSQTSLFESRKTAVDTQIEAIDRENALAKDEIAGLTAQSSRVAEQISLRTTYMNNIETLHSKGLVPTDRSLVEKINVAELLDRQFSVAAALAKAKSTIAANDRLSTKLKQDRRAEIDTEISKLEHDTNLNDIDIDAAQTAYRQLTGRDVVSDASTPNDQQTSHYQIVRNTNGSQQVVDATEFAPLQPSDIVVVK